MKSSATHWGSFLLVQLLVGSAVAVSLAVAPNGLTRWLGRWWGPGSEGGVAFSREKPLQIPPLYDDPSVVSDADLTMVLEKIRPEFPRQKLRPNYVEHALRTWGIRADFRNPAILSGAEMLDVLINHGSYIKSWEQPTEPLLSPGDYGVSVRWGSTDISGSVHHDHLLASLSEAGVSLRQKVFLPTGPPTTFRSLLQQAVYDFQPDEKETEWSAMAFALWLPPKTKAWINQSGRRITFDLIARRLMRGDARFGVCSGTHRVYSVVLMWRVDERFDIFSPQVRDEVRNYLKRMRDVIVAAQFPDGHWESNWARGKDSLVHPPHEPQYKAVIATGHHLEWLAIAPPEFHPPRAVVRKAARWLVEIVRQKTPAQIRSQYTFYTHVGNALALWRKTHPAEFLGVVR